MEPKSSFSSERLIHSKFNIMRLYATIFIRPLLTLILIASVYAAATSQASAPIPVSQGTEQSYLQADPIKRYNYQSPWAVIQWDTSIIGYTLFQAGQSFPLVFSPMDSIIFVQDSVPNFVVVEPSHENGLLMPYALMVTGEVLLLVSGPQGLCYLPQRWFYRRRG